VHELAVDTSTLRLFLKRLSKLLLALLAIVIVCLAGFRIAAALRETETAESLAPDNGRFVDTDYGKIHVSLWGNESAPPVLFTHGMAAWGGLWRDVAEHVVSQGYRVIALDQAPFGFSDNAHRDFSRTAQAERLKQVLDGLGIDKVFLVGHSYGGGVTLEAALRYPDRVSGLVLVCPVTGLMDAPQAGSSSAKSLPMPLRIPWLAEAGIAASATNTLVTGPLMASFMHKTEMMTPEHIATIQAPFGRTGMTPAMASWFTQFMAGDPQAKSAQRDLVKVNVVPAELIWGEMDTVTPIAQGEDLAALMGITQFARMPGIGHMPQLEDPAAFKTALSGALKRLSEGSFSGWSLRGDVASYTSPR
jgi:pimeloyl-ACP methyl ester carboxylesterase